MRQGLTLLLIKSGTGILLYGDKTGLNYASAFDRINVRRLFLTVEKALEAVANAQLFEFNDEITRANFSKCGGTIFERCSGKERTR